MMKISKSLFILMSIILLSASLSGCVKKQSQVKEKTAEKSESAETSNLKTFENKAGKLNFKYPKEWNFTTGTDSDRVFEGVLELQDKTQEQTTFWDGKVGFPNYRIVLRIENNPENLDIKDFAVKQFLPQSREKMKQKYKDITIGKHQGVKESGPITPPGSGDMTSYSFAPGNGKAYSFTYSAYAYKETHEKYINDLKKIIESIKFDK